MYTLSGRIHCNGVGCKTDDTDENGFFSININGLNDEDAIRIAKKTLERLRSGSETEMIDGTLWERRIVKNF